VHSLSRRLLISVSVPLALFCGIVILVLDSGFREVAQRTLQDELDRQMVALIAAAEPQPEGGYAPAPHTLDPRLETPRSGVYAEIRSAGHDWRSPSTAGLSSDFGRLLSGGQRNLSYASFGNDRVAIESRSIEFEGDTNAARALTFSVATSLSPYQQELWRFRRELGSWFGALMLLLLVTLAALLHWVLAPVRRMEREIHEVEEARRESLGGGYPRELAGVAGNLNALLIGERKRVARYRDTLGNLAHSRSRWRRCPRSSVQRCCGSTLARISSSNSPSHRPRSSLAIEAISPSFSAICSTMPASGAAPAYVSVPASTRAPDSASG